MTLPAFIYARFSSQEQGRGTSLVRQFENGRELVEQRGWLYDPEREISDQGRSAFHGANRQEGGELHAFERRVEKGLYRNGAVFVVEHFDRISRQGWEEVHAFLKLCVENGVSVATIDGDRFYPAGQRIDGATIMELVFKSEGAREESHKKSVRGLHNWQRKINAIQDGAKAVNIGLPPGWMDRDKRTNAVTLNPHRTAVLNEIFQMYVDGYGLPGIVRLLNDRKEPTWGVGKKNKGQGWNTAYLTKLLKNRAVLGEYEPMSRTHGGINETSKGLRQPNFYDQAVPTELFNKAEAIRGQRRFTGGTGEALVNNLFSGSAFCRHCGAPMYFQSQQKAGRLTGHKSKLDGRALQYVSKQDRSYLRCNNNRRAHQCLNNSRFRYEYLEPAVLDAVLSVAMDDRAFTLNDEVAALSANVAEQERQVAAKRQNLDSIVESLGDVFVKALAQKASEIEQEIERDEEVLQQMRADLARESGRGTPAENIGRVREVRAALNSEDKDARYAARTRVKAALQRLIRMECGKDGIATVTLANGLMAWRFNTQGEQLDSFDLRNRLDLHAGLTRGEFQHNKATVDAVLRR